MNCVETAGIPTDHAAARKFTGFGSMGMDDIEFIFFEVLIF